MNQLTSSLYAQPSFLEGVARTIDFAGTLNDYNRSPTEEMADYLALLSDWTAVGESMYEAFDKLNPRRSASELKGV